MNTAPEVLLIDNYDSFTYNLAQLVVECTGRRPTVVRNDVPWESVDLGRFTHVILSPGPGSPHVAADVGICTDVLEHATVPVLGVCLGHQLLAAHFGGVVSRAPEAMHGRVSTVIHDGDSLFAGMPDAFDVVRYHSLAVSEVPPALRVAATTSDGVVMALRHVERPLWGVQFHPESILSHGGGDIIGNFLATGAEVGAAGSSRWWMDVRRLDIDVDPEAAHRTLYADDESSFWLDSNSGDDRSRASVMGSCAGVLSHVLTSRAGAGATQVEFADGRREERPGDVLEVAERELAQFRGLRTGSEDVPFCLGYVGYLGYGLKADTCGVPDVVPHDLPDARLVFVERAVVFDHTTGGTLLLALRSRDPGSPLNAASSRWLEETEDVLRNLQREVAPSSDALPDLPDDATIEASFRFHHDRAAYLERIDRCKELILDGESYEICLTNTLEYGRGVDPVAAYQLLRAGARVPYGAFLRCGEYSVLSASPECFLRITAGGDVEARPIKGTRPRGETVEEDRRLRDDLRGSVKDQAENLMIVDLMRNDLNTVCEPGSVHVPTLFDVESFPSVHQLISTVRGRIDSRSSSLQCVRAAFPGGSMTGAPKIRTLEIIDELEERSRGVYSGAIGWLSTDGSVNLSIVIRTVVVEQTRATFGVGGAITQLSDPEDEYHETLVKARMVASAILAAARA